MAAECSVSKRKITAKRQIALILPPKIGETPYFPLDFAGNNRNFPVFSARAPTISKPAGALF
jgi:hypothetical protein